MHVEDHSDYLGLSADQHQQVVVLVRVLQHCHGLHLALQRHAGNQAQGRCEGVQLEQVVPGDQQLLRGVQEMPDHAVAHAGGRSDFLVKRKTFHLLGK